MHAPTYERARALWKEYCDTHPWSADDPRAELAAEVANRLEQLDLVLEHLSRSRVTQRVRSIIIAQANHPLPSAAGRAHSLHWLAHNSPHCGEMNSEFFRDLL